MGACIWEWLQENKGWFAGIVFTIVAAIATGVWAMLLRIVWPIQLAAHSKVRAIWIPNLPYAVKPHIVFLVSLKVHPRVSNTVNAFYLLIEHSGRNYIVTSDSGFGEGEIVIPIEIGTGLVKGKDIGPFQGRFEISETELLDTGFGGQAALIKWLMKARIHAVITTSYRNRWPIHTQLKLEEK